MAGIKCVDHKGMEFPSFKAMCEHWEKKPATVKRRLKQWSISESFGGTYKKNLERALEIPEVPGYRFYLKFVGLDNQPRFGVAINPKYKQYKKFDSKQTSKHGVGEFYTLEKIKKIFPKNIKAFNKGRMVGLY